MEDFPVCRAKHEKQTVPQLIFSYHIHIPSPNLFFSYFTLFLLKKLEWKEICLFFSKIHLSLLSFSTPGFTHLSHHDNYLHGNHSWRHKRNVTAEETGASWDPAGGKCPLWSKGLTGTKGILSWDFSRKVILKIYSCISVFTGFQSFLLPRSLWIWSKGHSMLKWHHITCTWKQTGGTSGYQPKGINP